MDTSNTVANGQPGTGNGKRLRLLAYIRVSSTNTAHHEPSEAEQRKVITGWAAAQHAKVTDTFTDRAVSGANGAEDRPELHAALAALHDGAADGLLVQHLDRLSRKLDVQEAVLGKVWAAGTECYAVQGYGGLVPRDDPDDPMRTAMRQVMGVMVQLDRGMVVARMRRGKRDKAARGGYTGGWVPLGMTVEDRELVPDPAEQAAVALILGMHEQGASLREIIAALEEGGHRTKRGGRWHPSTVSRTLARHGKIAPDQAIPRSSRAPRTPRKQRAAPPVPSPAPQPAKPSIEPLEAHSAAPAASGHEHAGHNHTANANGHQWCYTCAVWFGWTPREGLP